MRTPIRFAAVVLRLAALVLFLVPALATAQDVARMDQIVTTRVDDNSFMGTVLVARGDQVLLSKGYGFANLEWNVPNTPSTRFRLGSITKQFTAAAIVLLAERGQLAFEDPVKKHWPDAPPAWEAITVFHLLTHTSGIPSFTNYPDYMQEWKYHESPPEKSLEHVRGKPLDFAPGERMSYNNSGYVLLGLLIERVSGQTYADFLRDNIFEPLGMNDSGYDLNATIIANRAAGYSRSPEGVRNAPYVDMTIPHGAGALYSTTEDLLKWTRGVFGGKLVSVASLEKMTTPFKNDYAFGLVVNNAGDRKTIMHGGSIEGFNTELRYYPDSKITVVVLANVNGPTAGQLAGQLGALAHGETVRLPSERASIELP